MFLSTDVVKCKTQMTYRYLSSQNDVNPKNAHKPDSDFARASKVPRVSRQGLVKRPLIAIYKDNSNLYAFRRCVRMNISSVNLQIEQRPHLSPFVIDTMD